ncbi:conserved exported hypothetical protein [Rhodococcus sp. RD6.2]|uniref:YdcF family protein n=1 Tax=Rhodococcus sp. RD6.2 TaxID=260936 RepID=UPI00063B5614|nr:YdcF family protein [Rhodococcus sp. RD6.2]CRK49515.1 conserved exported hypothetical protein [Rhodococcus sp. RD6.2]
MVREAGTVRRRWLLPCAFVLVLLAAGVVGAGVPVYVHPRVDALRPVDAIFVLGGPGYERYAYGLDLARRGLSDSVVLSDPSAGEDDWIAEQCRTQDTFAVDCFAPQPATTRGEAEELGRLARARGWHSVIVVTNIAHVSRARFIVERCFPGDLVMAAYPGGRTLPRIAWQYVYQSAGYVRAALDPGC